MPDTATRPALTAAQRAELRMLAEQVPAGPWERLSTGVYQVDAAGGATVVHGLRSQALAEYVAALSPATVLALLDERDRLEARLAAVERARAAVCGHREAGGCGGPAERRRDLGTRSAD